LQSREGRLTFHLDFASAFLEHRRTLAVYLPPGYYDQEDRHYPVVYFHDGQNIFDPATAAFGVAWQADLSAERQFRRGTLPPLLMVGVYNTPARHDEYTMHVDGQRKEGGRGHLYGRFLFEEVKPFIDKHYRTQRGRETTAVIGSSLGGLCSLGLARLHHRSFGCCGILSPSLWWCGGQILNDIEERDLSWLRTMRFWLDMGTRETHLKRPLHPGIQRLRYLRGLFDVAGLAPGHHYEYQEIIDGEHNEASWASRIDRVLLYFFGRS